MTFDSDLYRNYLMDLAVIFKEEALSAKQEFEKSRGTTDEGYCSGLLMAWHTVISIMQQQAAGFDIPMSEIKLDGINPERDLI